MTIIDKITHQLAKHESIKVLLYSDTSKPSIIKDFDVSFQQFFTRTQIQLLLQEISSIGYTIHDFVHIIHMDNSRYSMRISR